MLKKAMFPGKYLQGAGAMNELPALIKQFGNKGMILASPTSYSKILPESGIDLIAHDLFAKRFGGECCEKKIT